MQQLVDPVPRAASPRESAVPASASGQIWIKGRPQLQMLRSMIGPAWSRQDQGAFAEPGLHLLGVRVVKVG